VEDLAGAAPAGEQVDLIGDARAGGVDEIDHRHAVRVRPLDDPDDLLDRPRAPGPGLDRGVVGHQAHLAPADPGIPGDHPVGRQPVGHTVGIEAVLDEGPVVDQERDPLAGEQLALGRVGGVVPLGAPGQHPLASLGQRLAVDRHHASPDRTERSLG
jgi:hypothetical protein